MKYLFTFLRVGFLSKNLLYCLSFGWSNFDVKNYNEMKRTTVVEI